MKNKYSDLVEKCRIRVGIMASSYATHGTNGAFMIRYRGVSIKVIAGCGNGWDHVSVSTEDRVPTWEEMCFAKDLFFEEEELVLQFHPPRSRYININKNVLHLWRPWDQKINLPPAEMV